MAVPRHAISPTSYDSPPESHTSANVNLPNVRRQGSMTTRAFGLAASTARGHQSQPRTDMKPGLSSTSNAAHHHAANGDFREHNGDKDDYDGVDEMPAPASFAPLSPSVPQLPALPISPVSPRWDSLLNGSSAVKYDSSSSLSDPTTEPKTSLGGRFQPSAFPGLSSHPFSTDRQPSVPSSPSIRDFPPLEQGNVGAQFRPLTPSSSTTKSYQTDSSPVMDGSGAVENFSRPRKPSIRQGHSELSVPRQRTGTLTDTEPPLSDQYSGNASLNPTTQPSGWPRGRGFSTSSTRSTNTFSSLAHRPSNDHLNGTSRTASLRRATPSSNMMRPPMAYSTTGSHSNMRDPPPWVTAENDELRSSFRSNLTTSTALGTVFTTSGTERSSVITKTSSITESLIINGYVRASVAEDDGLSVEDVMGMYENGFHDDSDDEHGQGADKEEGFQRHNDVTRDAGSRRDASTHHDLRPGTSGSETSGVVSQMLEAMSDPLPIPGSVGATCTGAVIARDSAAMFRNSGLPSSLPKDGFGLASERFIGQQASGGNATLAAKHGSAETLMADAAKPAAGQAKADAFVQRRRTSSTPPAADASTRGTSSRVPAPSVSMLPQEPEEDPSSRDRYGFRKANQYVNSEQYDAWNATYSEYLERRRKKWLAYQKDNSLMTDHPNRFPPRNSKTKRFIRKGIPPDWRGAAWFYYAGGPGIMAKHGGLYDELVRRAGLHPRSAGKAGGKSEVKPLVIEDIEKDLHRTFPDNVRFKPPRTAKPQPSSPATTADSQMTLTNESSEQSAGEESDSEPEIISSLRRVLHAFALYNPRIGYCQSLNFLAGLLLLFVETEEHAFWLLNVITRVYLPGTHEMSLEGSKVDLGVLMAALKDTLPQVWKQIGGDEADLGVPAPKKPKVKVFKDVGLSSKKNAPTDPNRLPAITLCMTAWFMSCFIGTLPMETVLRVWDIFFYEGSRTLFRIALTIFKVGEAEIKALADPMEMFGVVQALPRRMLDCNALLEACYKRRNGFGHLSQELVEEKRQERRDGIRKWKAVQEGDNSAELAAEREKVAGRAAAGLDLAADMTDVDGIEVRRKGTLFGRRRNNERARAADVL